MQLGYQGKGLWLQEQGKKFGLDLWFWVLLCSSCLTEYACGVLDADSGILQWVHRKTADVTDESAVSASPACWHWQNHRCQDQVSEFQVHEDQSAAGARFTNSSRYVGKQCVDVSVRTGGLWYNTDCLCCTCISCSLYISVVGWRMLAQDVLMCICMKYVASF